MRFTALLAMLLGCSSGPSVVVTDPPPVPIVVEPAEAPIEWQVVPQRHRDPVEAPRPIVVYVDTVETPLPEHPGEPEYAPLPDVPPSPPGSFQAAMKDYYATHPPIEPVVPNPSETPNSCECGDTCKCVDCQCPDCPHRTIKESLQVRFTLLSHPSCVHCKAAKKAAAESGVDVEIIESDEAWELARQAGAMRDFGDGIGLQPALPAWVVYVDGQPVKAWVGPSNATGVRQMREFVDAAAGHGSPGEHEAQRQDAGEPGEPPAWCVRIHITTRLPDGNLAIGHGSGAVVSPRHVLTNHHVVESSGRCRVKIAGEWREAKRVAYDPRKDLALLAVDAGDVPSLSVASTVVDGSAVTAHGYASGVVYRSQGTTIHGGAVDARSCGGESGGPVVDASMQLVGLIRAAEVESDPDGGRGLVVDLWSIRAFLARQGVL